MNNEKELRGGASNLKPTFYSPYFPSCWTVNNSKVWREGATLHVSLSITYNAAATDSSFSIVGQGKLLPIPSTNFLTKPCYKSGGDVAYFRINRYNQTVANPTVGSTYWLDCTIELTDLIKQ